MLEARRTHVCGKVRTIPWKLSYSTMRRTSGKARVGKDYVTVVELGKSSGGSVNQERKVTRIEQFPQ